MTIAGTTLPYSRISALLFQTNDNSFTGILIQVNFIKLEIPSTFLSITNYRFLLHKHYNYRDNHLDKQ